MKGYMLKFSQMAKVAAAALAFPLLAQGAVVEDINFASRPGGSFEVVLDFSETPPEPSGYSIEDPARIVLDLPGVESALEQKKHALSFDNARSAVVLSSGDKTRLVINLLEPATYDYRIDGNSIAPQAIMVLATAVPVTAALKASTLIAVMRARVLLL